MRLLPLALCALLLSACASENTISQNTTTAETTAPETKPVCTNGRPLISKLDADARRQLPGVEVSEADPALAAAIVEIYNNQPPQTNSEADRVLIYDHPALPFVIALLGLDNGCSVGSLRMPREALTLLKQRTRATI